jgi:hypothetical protein
MQDYFADIVGNVAITGNLVRIDYMRLQGQDKEKKQLKYELSHRLVMPLDCFLRSLETMDKLRQKMIDDGVLKLTDKASKP